MGVFCSETKDISFHSISETNPTPRILRQTLPRQPELLGRVPSLAVLGPESPCKSWAGISDNDTPSNHASNKTLRLPGNIMREQTLEDKAKGCFWLSMGLVTGTRQHRSPGICLLATPRYTPVIRASQCVWPAATHSEIHPRG